MKKKLMLTLAAAVLCLAGCSAEPAAAPKEETTPAVNTPAAAPVESKQAKTTPAEGETCSGTLITEVDSVY